MSSLASPFPSALGADPDDVSSCTTCYTVSLAQLIARVRERIDMVGSSFVSDSSLTDWINEAHQKLHGMCVDALGEEYVYSVASFTTAAGQMNFAITCCFYKLYGVDLEMNGRIVTLQPFTRLERNTYRNLSGNSSLPPRYRLTGGFVKLFPIPPDGLVGEVIYAPEATLLSLTTDTIKYPNGWERYIVVDAAIQALIKEESDVSALAAERELIVREIRETKELRDLAHPHQVTDVNMIDYDWS